MNAEIDMDAPKWTPEMLKTATAKYSGVELPCFTVFLTDFGDPDSDDYGKSVWIAAHINGDESKNIGAYVTTEGGIGFDDYTDWGIENDLVALGIDPESDEADALLAAWIPIAKAAGLAKLKEINC